MSQNIGSLRTKHEVEFSRMFINGNTFSLIMGHSQYIPIIIKFDTKQSVGVLECINVLRLNSESE